MGGCTINVNEISQEQHKASLELIQPIPENLEPIDRERMSKRAVREPWLEARRSKKCEFPAPWALAKRRCGRKGASMIGRSEVTVFRFWLQFSDIDGLGVIGVAGERWDDIHQVRRSYSRLVGGVPDSERPVLWFWLAYQKLG